MKKKIVNSLIYDDKSFIANSAQEKENIVEMCKNDKLAAMGFTVCE